MNSFQEGRSGVSAAHPLAVDVGLDIVKKGGNAVDASIAISFALSVLEPYGSGIGGGGVMMIHSNNDQKPSFYDYRECAPWKGSVSNLKIGVPGFIKGMERIHDDLGTLKWNHLIEPAIHLAEGGYPAHSVLIQQLAISEHLNRSGLSQFYDDGVPKALKTSIKQPQLAATLTEIAKHGSDVFYTGEIGKSICETVPDLHLSDLQRYTVRKSEVLQGSYDDYTIYSAPAPLAGSMLIQLLQMSEMMKLEQFDRYSADFIDQLAQILRTCYAERILFNEDPEFSDMDQQDFISQQHCERLLNKVFVKNELYKEQYFTQTFDYNNTTAFVVVDGNGMMVSTTNTLSDLFGSGICVNGFFLNNQMRNFSEPPITRNKLEPGKKPQSFIAPSILISEKEKIIIGSSGGKRIPNMLTKILIQHIKQGLPLQSVTDAFRYFVDEDYIFMEERLPESEERILLERDYSLKYYPNSIFYGGVHALSLLPNKIEGSADPRRGGKWMCV
ncbi:gamma-glutamyltransferase family protein [Halalkalibacter alkalisediminis]|uniref:Gamma-glutamyltransferase family protein n=1 Tax=Halalkalibacter alkalisediminis TaxID=935616 RepID=A0ABV6NN61_9BACI|nr:gamma-glutamyltransferase [Halalkalibacter alkalisediminis]